MKVNQRALENATITSKLDGKKHSVYNCMFDLDRHIKHIKDASKIPDSEVVSVYYYPKPGDQVLKKSTRKSVQCGQ